MCKACDLVKRFLIVQGYNACHTLDRRQHVFTEEGKADFPFLKRTDDKLFCSKCRSLFSIERGGRLDIIQHTQMKKHKLAAEEGMFAFQVVKHNISFRSVDCTSEVIKEASLKKIYMFENKM
jgi:hypothetical protein